MPLSIKDCNLGGGGGGCFHKAVRKVTNDFTNDFKYEEPNGMPQNLS